VFVAAGAAAIFSAVTKSELIDRIARDRGLSRAEAERAVEAVVETITGLLRAGEEVNITGFGKFHVAERAARQGVNPRTGERMAIAATRVPRFTAGTGLKSAVRG
jgi:DNA-binding protein HU-beta